MTMPPLQGLRGMVQNDGRSWVMGAGNEAHPGPAHPAPYPIRLHLPG